MASPEYSSLPLDSPMSPVVEEDRYATKKDRYGFHKNDLYNNFLQITDIERKIRNAKEYSREFKWIRMMKEWKLFTDDTNFLASRKLKLRLRKGIPDALRVPVWKHFLRYEEVKRKYGPPPTEEKLIQKLPGIIFDDIEKDINRTFPTHEQFGDGSVGQRDLKTLLECYAAMDLETGYCQGMSFVAAFLLTYMIPDEAYYCFVALMLEQKYPLRRLYQPSMYETQCILHVFGELGRTYLGSLWEHLEDQNMHPSMFATEWFMTLFCRGFTFDLVTRVFDLFVGSGMKIIYRVSLALLKSIESELMEAQFEGIMGLLRSIPSRCDAEVIMKIAFQIPLRREVIKFHEDQYVGIYKEKEEQRALRRASTGLSPPTSASRLLGDDLSVSPEPLDLDVPQIDDIILTLPPPPPLPPVITTNMTTTHGTAITRIHATSLDYISEPSTDGDSVLLFSPEIRNRKE